MRPTLRPNLYGLFFLFIAIATANGQSRTADFRENKVQAGAHEAKVTVSGNAQLRPIVQKIAESLKAPLPDWTIVILTEDQWEEWMLIFHHDTKSAFSWLGTNRTFVRERKIRTMSADIIRHTLAHELGNLLDKSASEDSAEKMAQLLLR